MPPSRLPGGPASDHGQLARAASLVAVALLVTLALLAVWIVVA